MSNQCCVQAAFGRQSLSISSFFVYVALGLGLLGSSLALPFGLYVLLFQRIPETGIQVRLWLSACAVEIAQKGFSGNVLKESWLPVKLCWWAKASL